LPGYVPPTRLEGDYSVWTYKWKRGYSGDSNTYSYANIAQANESLNELFIYDSEVGGFERLNLATGVLIAELSVLNAFSSSFSQVNSILQKYFVLVLDVGGVPTLRIYKDGTVLQNIDLNAICGWTNTNYRYFISFTPDGKYLLVVNWDGSVQEYALFEGS